MTDDHKKQGQGQGQGQGEKPAKPGPIHEQRRDPSHKEQANEHKTTDWLKPPPEKKK